MKKTITREADVCDECGTQTYIHPCLRCGIEFCYQCCEKYGRTYQHAIFFRGAGDGFYCKRCDTELTASGEDTRHNAYVAILSLRLELDAWESGFKRRKEAAEAALQQLL